MTLARDLRDRDEPVGFVSAWTNTPATFSVTANDPEGDGRPSHGVWVGVAGTLVVTDLYGTQTTLSAVPVGYHRMQITELDATSTAQNVVVGY